MAVWFPDMSCYFWLVKIHKIANDSAATEVRKNVWTDLDLLEFYEHFEVYFLLNLETIKF